MTSLQAKLENWIDQHFDKLGIDVIVDEHEYDYTLFFAKKGIDPDSNILYMPLERFTSVLSLCKWISENYEFILKEILERNGRRVHLQH